MIVNTDAAGLMTGCGSDHSATGARTTLAMAAHRLWNGGAEQRFSTNGFTGPQQLLAEAGETPLIFAGGIGELLRGF